MNDEEHIRREFDRLIGRHRKLIEHLCRRAAYGQMFYIRELMQECYVALLKCIQQRTTPMTEYHERLWVYWQCRSVIDRYRRKLHRNSWLPLTPEQAATLASSSDSSSSFVVDDLASCLEGSERHCFLLMADGASDKEIEKTLNLTHRTVVQMRHNIKKKLQQYINDNNEDHGR